MKEGISKLNEESWGSYLLTNLQEISEKVWNVMMNLFQHLIKSMRGEILNQVQGDRRKFFRALYRRREENEEF
jgi:hypothetical protein